MDTLPGIVVVSCSNTKPKSLIKLITKANDVKEDVENPGLIRQPWLIDTKYYTAEVNFLGFEKDFIRTEDFNNNVEALIIHMDSNKHSGLEDLSTWDVIESDCNLEVKLLISNYCRDDTKITRNSALEWCLKRGFEFIELYPSNIKAEPEDDVIMEKYGVDRVIEALQSHTWSNLIMKSKNKPKKKKPVDKDETDLVQSSDMDAHDDLIESEVVDDFTELFSHLHMMKDSLQSMPTNQRAQCAEQMVSAFWKAIGGEEEDMLDL